VDPEPIRSGTSILGFGGFKFQKVEKLQNSKNFMKPFGASRKVFGKGRFGAVGFLPMSKKNLRSAFRRSALAVFPAAIAR
jgi:hypothetical protein